MLLLLLLFLWIAFDCTLILTLITSQSATPAPYSDITDEAERRKKAIAEKEKGNDFYKKKKFMEAVHHYTAAIELFSVDMVFYLNRAGTSLFLSSVLFLYLLSFPYYSSTYCFFIIAAFYELSMYYKAVVDCWQAVELGSQDNTITPKLLSK